MSSTKEVLDRHLRSFGEQDLKGILSDYAPDAVFFTPEGPLKRDRNQAVLPGAARGVWKTWSSLKP
jgi:ketosteroid isomerase-like protein